MGLGGLLCQRPPGSLRTPSSRDAASVNAARALPQALVLRRTLWEPPAPQLGTLPTTSELDSLLASAEQRAPTFFAEPDLAQELAGMRTAIEAQSREVVQVLAEGAATECKVLPGHVNPYAKTLSSTMVVSSATMTKGSDGTWRLSQIAENVPPGSEP
jgi:hypothetical protein